MLECISNTTIKLQLEVEKNVEKFN